MQRYNPKDIEGKWQAYWDENQTYKADLTSDKPKYMAMSMFNYPSGAGIHIGHAMNYTISDVKARFKRQAGYESYHPVGWDAFGLPAENFAIKTGVSPQASMAKIIPDYHKQYKAMGWSNDWSKEIATHEPEYYKWTQWIFVQMYKQGLAYQDSRLQWWCEKDNTVLSNEQVIDGKCWRHDGHDDPLVQQKEVKQWFFKITEYADELLDAIDDLDWSDLVKLAQKNWIGRSQGAEVRFIVPRTADFDPQDYQYTKYADPARIVGDDLQYLSSGEAHRKAGDTFQIADQDGGSVIAIARITATEALRFGELEPYSQEAISAHEPETTPETIFTHYKYEIVADVVTVFTTRPDTLFGATFLVVAPEHELLDSIVSDDSRAAVQEYAKAAKRRSEVDRQAAKEKTGVFTGAYAINPVNGQKLPIWTADYVLTGYGTGAVMAVPAHDERDLEFAQKFELPITRVVQNEASDDECTHDEGVMINSGEYDGLESQAAREKIVSDLTAKGAAIEKINYKMRDWSVSRQRYWGAPIPIIHCANCGPQLVPDEQLPVVLPELQDFKPAGDGRSALARADDWLNTTCPNCNGSAERETDTLDTYICSSWYMFRYLDPHNAKQIFSSDIVNKWAPVDFYNGGDHATAHLLYARFVTRFFTKIGIMDNPEPFKQMLFNGKVSASDGSAFSKSKGNGIDPLEIINSGYGADALRTYLMFAAPLEIGARWDPQGVPGTYRFLNRLWTLVQEFNEAPAGESNAELTKALGQTTHRMIHKVTHDIDENRYNTAIAAAMTAVNDLYKLKVDALQQSVAWREAVESLVCCVAPFAPHISEELWHQLGHEDSVHVDHWPVYDESQLSDDTVTYAVQVNGKLRGEISVSADADKETVIATASDDPKIATHLADKQIKKTIVVPGKIVNFVVV